MAGTIHSTRLPAGLPLGGIGAGSIQVMTDGAIGAATINNNWEYPTGDLPGCFAAIHINSVKSVTRVLALHSQYGLPAVRGLDFDGLYPIASLTFQDPALPVAVSARAFSPLIPHDIKNSIFPAAAFVYRISNSTGAPVDVSLALSWENSLGLGGSAATGPFNDRTLDTVTTVASANGFFGMRFARPFSGEASVEGRMRDNAAGDMTLLAAPSLPLAVVTTTAWDASEATPVWWQQFERDGSVPQTPENSIRGVRAPAGAVCVRVVLKARETVDIPFAIAWYTPRLNTLDGGDYGHYYQTIWPDSYSAARSLLAEWRSLLALTEDWQERILFGNLPHWLERRLINSAAPLSSHTLLTRDMNFTLLGMVAEPSNGPTERAPASVPRPPGPAMTNSAPDSTASIALDSLRRRLLISGLVTDLFPILSSRELRLFMARQTTQGGLPASLGSLDRLIGVPQAGSVAALEESLALTSGPRAPLLTPDSLDDISAFLIEMAQYVLTTGDREFLQAYFPNIREALTAALESLDSDGLPVTVSGQIRPAGASLYLAGIQLGGRLCRIAGSQVFLQTQIHGGLQGAMEALRIRARRNEAEALAARCDAARARGAAAMESRYWTGSYYGERAQNGSRISSVDQLIGVALYDRLGAGGPAQSRSAELLDRAHVDTAAESIRRLNGGMAATPALPVYQAQEPGSPQAIATRICDAGAAVLGDVMLSLTHGRPEDAVTTLRTLDRSRGSTVGSPWQTPYVFPVDTRPAPLSGPAGLAQAADWLLLSPLQGFSLDLTSGEMSLSPSIPGTWRSLSAPVFAPTFWGRMEYHPTARGGVTSLRLDRLFALPAATSSGRLSGTAGLIITRVRIAGPPPRPAGSPPIEPPVAHASLGTAPLGVKTIAAASGEYIVVFDTPVKLTAGDRLEIDLH